MKLRGRSHTKLVIKGNPMISVRFNRVSKTRPCRICGKPTYCRFSRDEGTSICMGISKGSRGPSHNGGISTSIPKFHLSQFDRQLSGRLANQVRRLLLRLEMLFLGVDTDLARFALHKGNCRQPGCCREDCLRTTQPTHPEIISGAHKRMPRDAAIRKIHTSCSFEPY
jgi:hypothetical protein